MPYEFNLTILTYIYRFCCANKIIAQFLECKKNELFIDIS